MVAKAKEDNNPEIEKVASVILGILDKGERPIPPSPLKCTKQGQKSFLSKGFTHLKGKALIAVPTAVEKNLWPSERYLAKIRNGANENGLPDAYKHHLHSLQFFQIRSWKKFLMSGALLKQVEVVWAKLSQTIAQSAKDGKQLPKEFAKEMDDLQKSINAKEPVLCQYIGSGWRTDD
eukprot:TRINITY_DN3886_c0_g1_i2.p1 TRINITY_DN3886_c0_g1~~TRINITY_DN3886_c0_g1_i2.p1  ORF type:complete len:177 (-),score=71.37 TRINITY_DN3886_c0_g1_i2:59-589(-)